MIDIIELINEVNNSKKYASVSPEVVERVCADACKKYKKKKEAISEAKKQLHIIYESFLTNNCQNIARKYIETYSGESPLEDKAFSTELLALHVSTKERLEHIDETYSFISQFVDTDGVLSDVGCGFNPMALPFLQKKPKQYFAYEISQETVDVLNLYFYKIQKDDYHASILDAATSSPPLHSDLLLAFKLLPLLQQQKKGRAIDFLNEASFSTAIVSFPTKSLSGKNKGMEAFYSSFLEDNLPTGVAILERKIISNELFYVLKK